MVETDRLVRVSDNVESWVAAEASFACFRLSKRALQASLYPSTVYTVFERFLNRGLYIVHVSFIVQRSVVHRIEFCLVRSSDQVNSSDMN